MTKNLMKIINGQRRVIARQNARSFDKVNKNTNTPTNSFNFSGVALGTSGQYYADIQQCPAAFRCIDLIASSLAGLPILGNSKLNDPYSLTDGYTFWMNFWTRMLIEGNSFAAIVDGDVIPAKIISLFINEKGEYGYKLALPKPVNYISTFEGRQIQTFGFLKEQFEHEYIFPESKVLHFRFSGSVKFNMSPSPYEAAGRPLLKEWGELLNYKSDLLSNRLPFNRFKIEEQQDGDNVVELKEEIKSKIKQEGRTGVIMLANGIEMDKMDFIALDPAVIEFMKNIVVDWSRVYGVSPFLVNHIERNQGRSDNQPTGQWFNFLKTTLQKHVHMAESELKRKFYGDIKFDVMEFMRGHLKEAAEIARLLTGTWTPNEKRRLLFGLDDVDGGDKLEMTPGTGVDKERSVGDNDEEDE